MNKSRKNGGYVMIYVVVVIVILCILIAAASSNSLKNLKAQQASIQRTQDLYTAEGRIEEFAAKVEAVELSDSSGTNNEDAVNAARNAFSDEVNTIARSANVTITPADGSAWRDNQYQITVTSKANDVTVSAVLTVSLTIQVTAPPVESSPPAESAPPTEPTTSVESSPSAEPATSVDASSSVESVTMYYYNITGCTVTYESYDTTGAEGGDGT